jgi:hypothetical protein
MNRTRSFGRAELLDLLSLAILMLSISAAVADNLYRWTDEKGQVHYSDKKPAVKKWERVNGGTVNTIPNDVPATSTPVPQLIAESSKDNQTNKRTLTERRQKLIGECERNRGVDCAHQVDTDLGAKQNQTSGHVIHQAPPTRSGASSR